MDDRIKRPIYIFCTMVFGFLLGLIVCTLLVPVALKYGFANLGADTRLWLLVLPTWVFYPILIAGALWGLRLGRIWWRIVYIEHHHWRFHKEERTS